MVNPLIGEHVAFQKLTESLASAADAATNVGHYRPDEAKKWFKVAETLRVTREACFRLAGEGTVGKHHG